MLSAVFEVADHVRAQRPDWDVRFAATYLGNPVLFFSYGFLLARGEDSWLFSKKVGTNTYWLNPVSYILITLPVYVLWISLHRVLLRIDLGAFLEHYVSPAALITAAPGLLNLYVWCTSGMEGNIMGFIFFLPLLIATVANFLLWVWCTAKTWRATSHEIPLHDAALIASADSNC